MENTFNQDELECPYCHKMVPDPWELMGEMEDSGEVTCGSCERDFLWVRDISIYYKGKPIT